MKNTICSTRKGSILKTCPCGRVFGVSPSRRAIAKYCSRKCQNEAQKKQRIRRKCPGCGTIIESLKTKSGQRKFCSHKCYICFVKDRRKKLEETRMKNCAVCNKSYLPKQGRKTRYCSVRCANSVDGKSFMKLPKRGKKLSCDNCGKKAYYYPHQLEMHKLRFCNNGCMGEYFRKNGTYSLEKHPQWKGGKSFEPYTHEFNERLREKIRRRDGRKCQECGYGEVVLGYHLSVHHIDYNKKNNAPENLISLCNSCHVQTNFGRDDWRKYFKKKMGVLHA